ncbi:hypothetical protein, partial [Robiginitalea biformata]|uniref:hypothetical protein n=1 Tax=Robiginitalea biformata TaxID=252307 RepID=UPI003D34741A
HFHYAHGKAGQQMLAGCGRDASNQGDLGFPEIYSRREENRSNTGSAATISEYLTFEGVDVNHPSGRIHSIDNPQENI